MVDAFRIGVSIAMKSNGAEVLSALSKSLLGVHVAADQVRGSLNRIHVATAGLGAVLSGSALVGGMIRLANAGKEFAHQQSLMVQAGIQHRDIAAATAAAWQNAGAIMGSNATQNLALIADLRNRLGSMNEAIAVAPAMTRMGVYLQNLTGRDAEQSGADAGRFLEQRGALVDPRTHQISSAHLEQQSRLLEAISAGTRGRVGPQELLGFQQYARLAGSALSDQGLINLAPVIAASRSGSSVGTQLSSLQQQLRGGIMTQAGATWLENLHILDGKRVHIGRGGHLTIDDGALRGADQLQADPVTWVRDVLTPALVKAGYTTTEAQNGALLRSHLRSTVIGLLGEIVRNMPAFMKDAGNIRQAAGVDQYDVSQKTDPTAKINTFTAAWHNLTTALGSPLVNDTTGAIGKLARGINRLATVINDHPRAAERIELLALGLGGLVALSGGIAITGAALGPMVGGIRALTAVMAGAEVATAVVTLGTLGAAVATLAAAIGAAGALHYGLKSLDHKYGYDDGSPITWADKADPFNWFHHHKNAKEIAAERSGDLHLTVPLHVDGKQVAKAVATIHADDLRKAARSTSSSFDGWGSPRLPGVATGN